MSCKAPGRRFDAWFPACLSLSLSLLSRNTCGGGHRGVSTAAHDDDDDDHDDDDDDDGWSILRGDDDGPNPDERAWDWTAMV